MLRPVVWILFWLAVAGGARAQSVIWQDGFESPAVAHSVGFNGDFTFGDWTGHAPTAGGNAGVVRGPDNGLAPFEGAQMFALNGGSPPAGGWIEQSLTLVGGVDYVVRYAIGRGGQVGQLLNIKIEIDAGTAGGQVLNADLQSPPQANAYAVFELGFTAPADGTVMIRFTDLSGPNQVSDLWLDAVSMRTLRDGGQTTDDGGQTAIPEPGAWTAVCGAMAGVVALFARWWRNREPPTVRQRWRVRDGNGLYSPWVAK